MRAVDDARVALQAVPRSTDDFRTRLVLRSELLEERGNALQAAVGEQANPASGSRVLLAQRVEAICILCPRCIWPGCF